MEFVRRTAICTLPAILLWLGLGFSLGWYYTITYYGRQGWPMPLPENLAALLLYYFSVLNVDTSIQAVHWMAVYPASGMLWAAALVFSARYFGIERPSWSRACLMLALASAPVVLMGPWLAYEAGQTAQGFDAGRMMAVALRRGFVSPWGWLSPVYLTVCFIALMLQVEMYRRLFPTSARNAVMHGLCSIILLTLTVIVLGTLLSFPLRAALE